MICSEFALSSIRTGEVKVKGLSSSAIVIIGTKGYIRKKFLFSKESVVQGRWINLIPKWWPIHCSFVCMLISPLCLLNMDKAQKNFEG